MRAPIVASVLVLSTVIAAPKVRAEEERGVTTSTWTEPDAPLDLHWHILALPEYVVELAFSPIGVLVANVEKYRLDLRLYDLLRNDAGTIVFTPKLKVGGGDGFGFGGNLSFKRLFDSEDKIKLGGLWRVNGDFEAGIRYKQAVAAADGRVLEIGVEAEVDQNRPYYGIGNGSGDVKHVMEDDVLNAQIAFDLIGAGALSLSGELKVGFRYADLSNGTDPRAPGVGDMDSSVTPPPEFGEAIGFPWVDAALRFDRRDNIGRPTRGYLAEIRAGYTQDVSSKQLSAITGELRFDGFIPLLPEHRVLLLGFGVAGAVSPRGDDQVPTHQLVTLGRKRHLRGYGRGRFRDELGYWATAEYRWPIWEYLETGVALSPMIFFDAGRVAADLEGVFEGPIRYSGGVGVRGAHEVLEVLRLQIGLSPEGLEIDFGVGGDL